MSSMTPREIVQELDKHIVGQAAAKRAVTPSELLAQRGCAPVTGMAAQLGREGVGGGRVPGPLGMAGVARGHGQTFSRRNSRSHGLIVRMKVSYSASLTVS